jgi:uncharacterized protein (UPF0147 family)
MTGKQKKALAALLNSRTMRAAAQSAGVNYSTLRRWIVEDAEFRKAYNDELAVLIENAANQARQGMTEAVDVLREIINDEDAPQSNRLAAAKVLIESGSRLIEMQSFDSRITELERLMEDRGS